MTCSVCGETAGAALGHKEGDWKTRETDMVDATVTSKKYCTMCNREVGEKTVSLKALHDGETFLMTPSEFVKRLSNKLDTIDGGSLSAVSGSYDGDFVCGFLDGSDKSGALMFTDGDGALSSSRKNEACIHSFLGSVEGENNALRVLLATILTCDPTLSFSDAQDIGSVVIINGEFGLNGVTYVFSLSDDGAIIGGTVDNE